MKIILLSEESIRLEPDDGPMTIEALSPEQSYSPFHMLASSLAFCTFSVLYSWAQHAHLEGGESITIDVRWTFADDPHRVGTIELDFNWPALDPRRIEAARRVAELCTVHATLTHPPAIVIAGETRASAPIPAGAAR